MTNETNKPVDIIRDGLMRASIFGNQTENGTKYNVELSRSYEVDGKWHYTNSLSNGEMLRGARLLNLAYDRVLELRAEEKS